jgi:hypothetical protein
MMKILRRVAYGIVAWLFVFALASVLAAFTPDYVWLAALAAPLSLYWLAVRCMRKKKPDWGSEGLKAGAIWLLVAAFIDLAVLPMFPGPYDAFLSANFNYAVYFELLAVPWLADKLLTSRRKI